MSIDFIQNKTCNLFYGTFSEHMEESVHIYKLIALGTVAILEGSKVNLLKTEGEPHIETN